MSALSLAAEPFRPQSWLPKLEAAVARAVGTAKLYHAYFSAKDETTQRLKTALAANRWAVYPNSAPESGKPYYSSLQYPNAEAARAAFARNPHSLVYGRDGTPHGDALTKVLLQLDPAAADGRVTGQGMGAVEAALLGAKSGEHIVASKFIFGTTKRNLIDLAQERGVGVSFIDGRDPQAWEQTIQPGKTRIFFFEPVGNPGMERTDTKAVAAIAHKNGRDILTVADNSMTPLDRALSNGADIVAFSTTKLLGLGIDNGGAVLFSKPGLERLQRLFPDQPAGFPVLTKVARKGWTQSHRGAHAMLRRAALSALRVQQQTAMATELAQVLQQQPTLQVRSTALDPAAPATARSPVFALDLGTQDKAFRFIDALAARGIGIVNNFGSARTTIIHPGTTTQSSLSAQQQAEQGISPGLVRVSVGVEGLPFLKKAFTQALQL